MNNLANEFKTLKNSQNINALVRFSTKVNNAGGRTSAIDKLIETIINNRFINEINSISPMLLAKRRVEIRSALKNNNLSSHVIELVKDGKVIAAMETGIQISIRGGQMSALIKLKSGWTLPNYSKNGPMRPANGHGYGTILRAIIVHAAKKLKFLGATQNSVLVSKENHNKFNKGIIKRPASAWIMNKLGFNIENVNIIPGTNKVKAEHRVLRLKNATPKLNAVIRNIFGNV